MTSTKFSGLFDEGYTTMSSSVTSGSVETSNLISHFTLYDLLIPLILISTTVLIRYINQIVVRSPTRSSSSPVHAHLFRAQTAHARFLPVEAAHVFKYPVLFFGVDLDALELGQADVGNRWFRYRREVASGEVERGRKNKDRWSVTSLRPGVYFEPTLTGQDDETSTTAASTTIKQKLLGHLTQRGLDGSTLANKVYTVTMPAFLGLQDINPLTIHYCYSMETLGGRKLEVVVLEVSNTFGEKHLYVLQVGVEEDDKVAKGYEHQWTFPRAFHVSPFNDRSGFYRVSVKDPLRIDQTTEPSLSLPSNPHLDIKIVTLTSDGEKKLYASLTGHATPLDRASLLSAILRWPLALLLTTPRILYQAMLLHYGHRLDVFPRPDPFVATGEMAVEQDTNPVQVNGKDGAIQWQELGSMEKRARDKTVAFLRTRVEAMASMDPARLVRVVLKPADRTRREMVIEPGVNGTQEDAEGRVETLDISYTSPLFFVDLYTSPTIAQALELGSHTEHRWRTSNYALFLEIFTSEAGPETPRTRSRRMLESLRLSAQRWGLSFLTPSFRPRIDKVSQSHPLDDAGVTFADVRAMWLHFVTVKAGYWIFVATRARFVRGTEPWEEWARWGIRQGTAQGQSGSGRGGAVSGPSGEIQFGSVLRPRVRIK